MFAIRCPYCQHENKPGARFCADCGAPLHLKPCAKCGKVDDVTAKACSSCKTPFPAIELVEYGTPEPAQAQLSTSTPEQAKPVAEEAKPVAKDNSKPATYGAMPLVVIALFAGGVPLLWMNRGQIPVPGWKDNEPSNLVTGTATRPPSPVVAPPAVPPSATSAPAPRTEIPAATGQPVLPAAAPQAPNVSASVAAPASPVQHSASPVSPPPPVAKEQPSKTEARAQKQKAVDTDNTQRSCTAAVAALGLCDPAQGKK
jgi:hypothetical protein